MVIGGATNNTANICPTNFVSNRVRSNAKDGNISDVHRGMENQVLVSRIQNARPQARNRRLLIIHHTEHITRCRNDGGTTHSIYALQDITSIRPTLSQLPQLCCMLTEATECRFNGSQEKESASASKASVRKYSKQISRARRAPRSSRRQIAVWIPVLVYFWSLRLSSVLNISICPHLIPLSSLSPPSPHCSTILSLMQCRL
ncbi:hypothetical protein V1506DRAFT_526489 [Lipomyces tetrasporus]